MMYFALILPDGTEHPAILPAPSVEAAMQTLRAMQAENRTKYRLRRVLRKERRERERAK